MTKLMVQNGKLLTSGGKLTVDQACCCDDVCPTCCMKINNGALIDGQYRFFVENGTHSMEVLVSLPGGLDTICDDESMKIDIIFTGEGSPDAYVDFDPMWKHVTSAPEPSRVEDKVGGFVLWEDNIETEYAISLAFNHCFIGSADGTWGRVRVGGHGLEVDIESRQCGGSPCCEVCPPCKQCCFRLTLFEGCIADWNYDPNAEFLYQAFELGPYYVLFEAKIESDSEDIGLVCGDAVLEVRITVSSRDPAALDAFEADQVRMDFNEWKYEGANPAPDNAESVELDRSAVWNNTTAREYTGTFSFACDNFLPEFGMSVKINPDEVGAGLIFQGCPSEDCNCCCDHCCSDCHFPVTTDRSCDNPELTPYEIEGTRIVNLITTVTASSPVFCDGTSDTETFEQVGPSGHLTGCVCKCLNCTVATCRVSGCVFVVTLQGSCGDPFDVSLGYNTGGDWGIQSGGVGYVYWGVGRLTYSGDCTGASATGQFTNAGVNFTWETSFEVQRDGDPDTWTDCPLPEEEDSGGSGG